MVQRSSVVSQDSSGAKFGTSSIARDRSLVVTKDIAVSRVVETRDDPDLPKVTLAGDKILCDGREVHLGRSALMVRLFTGFCRSKTGQLTRAETFYAVYGVPLDDRLSTRRRASMLHNMVKLVSRARSLMSTELGIKRGDHRWLGLFMTVKVGTGRFDGG